MERRALIVVNAYHYAKSTEHMANRLIEEGKPYGVSFDVKGVDELGLYLDEGGEIEGDLPYDFGIFLDKDLYASLLLEKKGLRIFDTAKAIALADDKMLTHVALAKQGIRMPKTISAPLRYCEGERPSCFLKEVTSALSFPLIGKLNYGSLGNNVFLLHDEGELEAFEKKHAYEPHLYQEFIASSRGFDVRVIVIGGKFVASMKRRSLSGDFRSNLALGGVAESFLAPLEYQRVAEKASQIMGLDYAGVDLLYGEKGEPILCEVNSNAYVGGIERASGVNVAGAYLKHIVQTIYGE